MQTLLRADSGVYLYYEKERMMTMRIRVFKIITIIVTQINGRRYSANKRHLRIVYYVFGVSSCLQH